MRLVHQNYEIRERSEIVEIRLTEIFRQAAHPRLNGDTTFLSSFVLGVELGNIEDIDFNIREQAACTFLIVFACNNSWRLADKFAYSLKHIFGISLVAEVLYQLLVES